jgi:hypothetical protein
LSMINYGRVFTARLNSHNASSSRYRSRIKPATAPRKRFLHFHEITLLLL